MIKLTRLLSINKCVGCGNICIPDAENMDNKQFLSNPQSSRGPRGTCMKIKLSPFNVAPLGALLQEYDPRNTRHRDHILYYM
jgi:hypothetical protein